MKKNINLKELIKANEERNIKRINTELENAGMAYKIKDAEENEFVYAGLENGLTIYRTNSGQKVINELNGYKVIELQII